MPNKKHLLTHVFMPIVGLPLMFSPAVAMPAVKPPVNLAQNSVVTVAMSVEEARAAVRRARQALKEAMANGGDVDGAQAALQQAEEELNAAQAAGDQQGEGRRKPERQVEEAAPPASDQAATPQDQGEVPVKKRDKKRQMKEAQPAEEQAAPENMQQQEAPVEAQQAEPAPAQAEKPRIKKKKKQVEEQAAPAEEAPQPEEQPTEQAAPQPETQQLQPEAAAPTPEPAPAQTEKPRMKKKPTEEQAAPTEEAPAPEEQPTEQAVPQTKEAAPEVAPPSDQQQEAAPQKAEGQRDKKREGKRTPVLDSAKDGEGAETASEPPPADAEQLAAPNSDADAQMEGGKQAAPVVIERATREEGRRIRRAPQFVDPQGAEVEQTIRGRDVLRLDGRIIIRGDDTRRFDRGGGETTYEQLSHGRVRETVTRPNGVLIVTIRNRYGDIIQRSRIDQRGRETVLFYAPELQRDPDEQRVFLDPSLDLPPMRLRIPVDEYIIDTAEDPDRDYYDFLREPPVEPVERVYSLDEVRYSARVRDKMRRIDLDTVHFATGSAEVSMNQAETLESVAEAMKRIIDRDPGETFLIEGHTDAVGSDQSNLVLSDERAESVAEVLSRFYDIPPENLVTQGYGERFLKVQTDGPSQENRRVTIRRITALVRPVAANQ